MDLTKQTWEGLRKLIAEGRVKIGDRPSDLPCDLPESILEPKAQESILDASLSPVVRVGLPPTTNNLFTSGVNRRTGRPMRPKSQDYQDWLESWQGAFKKLVAPGSAPWEIRILIRPGKKWRSNFDVANREKAITDAIKNAGVIPDDSSKYVTGVRIALGPRIDGEASFAEVQIVGMKPWWATA